jgi:hypothetical protein
MNEPVTHHRLHGLEPDNLLAFLALLGLLRALDATRPDWRARAYWQDDPRPLRPVLVLTAPQTPGAVTEAAAAGAAKLAAFHVFDRKDLNQNVAEAREALMKANGSSLSEALICALMCDAAVRDNGHIWPTPFCFLFGQGHQHFLERLVDVPNGKLPKSLTKSKKPPDLNSPNFIDRTLFAPWTRSDPSDSFRWDPSEDRRYALRSRDPSGDPSQTEHGANRLAAVGLPVLSGAPILRRNEVRFLNRSTAYGGDGGIEISWPNWALPARLAGIRALLARRQLSEASPSRTELARVGISGLWRAQRISVGKYFNITRARRLA